ncbi:hypothetical protein [Eubacterium sp.]|uniref:hypothetical protein n=1 Tax=Eubacterium sp. TaxID=142586 RepID=UPI0025B7AA01|nr:hypothetical protein [Eubacterium sp.]
MANEKNLIPFGDNSKLTESEQRALQSKGGKASGRKRAENKRRYENWKALGDMFLPMALKKGKLTDINSIADLNKPGVNITAEEQIFFSLLVKAMKGDLSSIKTLFELTQWNKTSESGNADGNNEVNAFIEALNGKADIWDDEWDDEDEK